MIKVQVIRIYAMPWCFGHPHVPRPVHLNIVLDAGLICAQYPVLQQFFAKQAVNLLDRDIIATEIEFSVQTSHIDRHGST